MYKVPHENLKVKNFQKFTPLQKKIVKITTGSELMKINTNILEYF